jgi:hypothetical protein
MIRPSPFSAVADSRVLGGTKAPSADRIESLDTFDEVSADGVFPADEISPAESEGTCTVSPGADGSTPAAGETFDHSTDFQLAEWQRRQELVRHCLEMRVGERGGATLNAAAQTLGEPVANLCRYMKAFREGGAEALKPSISTGRPIKFVLSPDEKNALRLENLKRNSFALAVEWFPRNAACTPATRALILTELDKAARARRIPSWPVSLRRAGAISDEERALFRGEKSFQNVEHAERRGMFYVAEDGTRAMLAPNTVWESDDMSLNEPFRFGDPETGALRMGRQTLNTIDVFSAFWLAGQPLGRPRDAYRVEDIADHMAGCLEAHGMPLVWRLERGVWENEFVKGVAIEGREQRWGGLDKLFRIQFVFKSRGKGLIESSFNLLQDIIAHESTSIGRSRGEFERATSLFLKAQKGDADAAAHFWDIATAADGLVGAMIAFNQRPKKRRAHGRAPVVPSDLFQSAPRREVPAGERWRLCPVKREATVRQGHIECVVDHYPLPFRFRVNGAVADLYLQHGHHVLIAFHPGRPEEGCHVFNAEGENERNRDGFRFGEHMLTAPLAIDTPQFNLAPHEREFHARKNANAAVRTEFRAITKAGTPIVRRTESRDGWGNRSANFAASAVEGGRNSEPSEAAARQAPSPAPRRTLDPEADAARIAALEREDAGELMTL